MRECAWTAARLLPLRWTRLRCRDALKYYLTGAFVGVPGQGRDHHHGADAGRRGCGLWLALVAG